MRAAFFRPLDACLLAVYLAALAASVLLLRGARTGTPLLVVGAPGGEYVYPLDKDRTVAAAGALGISLIVIQDGSASFADSPCPNHLCVQSPAISRGGDWTACLPNQVFIRIETDDERPLDAVTR